jgi:hypothetical protein
MIWSFALPDRQVVTIKHHGYYKEVKEEKPQKNIWVYPAKASYTIPGPLHSNHEGRTFALKKYGKALGAQLGGNPVYFYYNTDMQFFEDTEAVLHSYGGTALGISDRRGFWGPKVAFPFDIEEVHQKVRFVAIRSIFHFGDVAAELLNMYENLESLLV